MNDWRMYTDASGEEVNHSAWHEVLQAIAQLNGSTNTLVHAACGDHVDLVVAGGNKGQVLIQWKENEPKLHHYVLTTENTSSVMSTLTIEGSDVAFPIAWCVPLDQAVPVCGDILRTLEKGTYQGLQWLEIEKEMEM